MKGGLKKEDIWIIKSEVLGVLVARWSWRSYWARDDDGFKGTIGFGGWYWWAELRLTRAHTHRNVTFPWPAYWTAVPRLEPWERRSTTHPHHLTRQPHTQACLSFLFLSVASCRAVNLLLQQLSLSVLVPRFSQLSGQRNGRHYAASSAVARPRAPADRDKRKNKTETDTELYPVFCVFPARRHRREIDLAVFLLVVTLLPPPQSPLSTLGYMLSCIAYYFIPSDRNRTPPHFRHYYL